MNTNHLYTIDNKYLQLSHNIALALHEKQQQIEPGKKGIITELSKLISYLDSKIEYNTNLVQEERKLKRAKFFTYLELLAEHSDILGHSNKTPLYYEAIFEICNRYIKDYQNEPSVLIQVLAWCQRLMHYYRTLDDNEIDNLRIEIMSKKAVVPSKVIESNNSKAIATETSQTSKTPQKPQENKPTPPNYKKSKQTNKPQKPIKPSETPKLTKPKQSQPPKPWERPAKK